MIKIVNKYATCERKKSEDIHIGTVFTGKVGAYNSVFMACHQRREDDAPTPLIVNLKDPSIVWSNYVDVYDYKEVNITITIED